MHSRGNLPNDLIKGLALIILVSAIVCSGATALASGQVTILCYHSIQPNGAHQDHYTISQNDFTAQMEYLHTHGYTPINLKDLLAARKGDTMLPEKPVMLTFDDGYRSYAEFVVPLLNYYGFPSMLAVVGSWIDGRPPQGLPEPLLSWERLRMLSSNPLVTIVSHTYDLHKGVRYTPQGNQGAAVGVRLFPEQDASPESEEQYYARLKNDFSRQQTTFIRELGTLHRPPWSGPTGITMPSAWKSPNRLAFRPLLRWMKKNVSKPMSRRRTVTFDIWWSGGPLRTLSEICKKRPLR